MRQNEIYSSIVLNLTRVYEFVMRKYFNFLLSFSTVAYLAFFYVIDGIFLFSKGEGATRKVSVYGRGSKKNVDRWKRGLPQKCGRSCQRGDGLSKETI